MLLDIKAQLGLSTSEIDDSLILKMPKEKIYVSSSVWFFFFLLCKCIQNVENSREEKVKNCGKHTFLCS